MIKFILKIFAVLLLLALAVFAFIKLLPWAIAVTALIAIAKFTHHWFVRNGIIPGPAKPDDGHRQGPTPAPQQ